jgi:hypothetical protein
MSEPLWEERFNRNALAILNIALVYYQKPTFPTLQRHDYYDNLDFISKYDINFKKSTQKECSAEDIEEADQYATSLINIA